jgi:cobalt/nickel transport system ATP-binding protein
MAMSTSKQADSELVFHLSQVEFAYFENHPALKADELKIHQGESLAIVGSNGCGKSTLLSIMDGLLFPTRGFVEAYGTRLTEQQLSLEDFARFFRSRVAFVFQNPDVQLFCPTVLEEVSFGPLQLDIPKTEVRQRAHDVLALLGIEHLAERAPFSLSGGEKKKVGIASVLSMNPEVLLLDEPGNGLDPRSQAWLIEFLQQLKETGKTIVTATHDLSIVDEIAERILVLDETHRLIADGEADEVLRDEALLLKANLIHEHYHHHDGVLHRHLHSHVIGHGHKH